MTTADHQWLATSIFPKFVIDKVMNKKINITDQIGITEIGNNENTLVLSLDTPSSVFNPNYKLNSYSSKFSYTEKDILNQKNLKDKDQFGNKVVVNDIEQGLVIIEVKDTEYTGYLMMIDDPSRVFVGTTQKSSRGETLLEYFNEYDIIASMNANGFSDPNGQGHGETIIGCTRSEGKDWCNAPKDYLITGGFTENNELIIGKMSDWDKYKIRDAVQYEPILILNGEKVIDGSGGWGLQPRTILAQRKDGVVMFLAIDGRKPGYSIGATMGTCADILLKYGAYNALAMDGGSSTTMAYNGKLVNVPSTPMVTGRYLPNALMVRKK